MAVDTRAGASQLAEVVELVGVGAPLFQSLTAEFSMGSRTENIKQV